MSLAHLAREQTAPRAVAGAPAPPAKQEDRFDQLVKYIPTETITLYIAAMAIHEKIQRTLHLADGVLYAFFALATPVILLLVINGKQRETGADAAFFFPAWKLFASLVAFLAWGLSVPGTLPAGAEDQRAIAAFLALFVSILLPLLEPVFGPRPKPANTTL